MELLTIAAEPETCNRLIQTQGQNNNFEGRSLGANEQDSLRWLSLELGKRRIDIHRHFLNHPSALSKESFNCVRIGSPSSVGKLLFDADVHILNTLLQVDLPSLGVELVKHDWRVSVVVQCIAQMCSLPHLTLGTISPKVGVTPRYLGRLFYHHTNVPFHRYLRAFRISTAADWLCVSLGPIKQAAALCGYSSPNNFIRDFIDETGLSPSQYRNLRRTITAVVTSGHLSF